MAEAHAIPRTRRGDVIENTVTGERAIVLVGTEESGGGKVVVFLGVRPGGAVVGEHVHSALTERFRVVCGRLGVRIDGAESELGPGDEVTVQPGVVHDWWNAGDEEAQAGHALGEHELRLGLAQIRERLAELGVDRGELGGAQPHLLLELLARAANFLVEQRVLDGGAGLVGERRQQVEVRFGELASRIGARVASAIAASG